MKIISVLLMSIMVLLLAGCGKDRVNDNTVDDGQNDMSDYSADINVYNDFSEQVQTSNMDKMLSANLQYPSSNAEWEYNVYDCYVEITGHKGGPKETLVIPDEIESLPVWKYSLKIDTSDQDAYKSYSDIVKTIVFPKDLLVIDDIEGYFFKNVENVVLSNSLVKIERAGFNACESLKAIEFPETLEEIGDDAFSGCHSLRSVVLPKSVKKLGYLVFMCTNLGEPIVEKTSNGSTFIQPRYLGVELTVYNPEMEFSKNIGDVSLIRGYAGSTAAKYAAENNIKFEVID